MDSWDGYPASRDRVLAGAEAAGIENLMVLTGDVHVDYAFDIKKRLRRPRRPGPSAPRSSPPPSASGKDGADKPANWDTYTEPPTRT